MPSNTQRQLVREYLLLLQDDRVYGEQLALLRAQLVRAHDRRKHEIQARCSVLQTACGMPREFALLRFYVRLYYMF